MKWIVIVLLTVLILVICAGGWWFFKGRNNASGSSTFGIGRAKKAEETLVYKDPKFGFSFSYPKSWGTVTIETTTTTNKGVSGVASYNGKFSNKTPGDSLGGSSLPYMFRVNSFRFPAEESTYTDPTTAYRVVATDHYDDLTHLSPGLSYCRRVEPDSEECPPFSNLGDWKDVNGALLAKGTNNGGGGEPALFISLTPLTGENYTMFSMYSSSTSDYDTFVALAQSFKK